MSLGSTRRIALVARFELVRHLRSFRFLVGSLLLVVLSALVTWLGYTDHRLRLDAYETTRAAHQAELERVTVYSFFRPVVSQPPEPLAIFERGVTGQAGRDLEISPFRVPTRATGEHRGNPYLSRWLDLDLTTVVVVVAGLLALLLTFDALVGERSQRRLDVWWAHGGTWTAMLLGKLAAVVVALGMAFAVALGPPIIALFAVGVFDLSSLEQLVALVAAYGAYTIVMALLGLWISLEAPSEARSLAYAVLTWVGLVFLLPQAAVSVIEVWTDLHHDPRVVERRQAELDATFDAALDAAWNKESLRLEPSGHTAPIVFDTWDHKVLRRLGSARYYASMVRYYAEEVRLGRDYADRGHALFSEHEAKVRALARPLAWFELLSPGDVLERLAATLAGTSLADHDAFVRAARVYRDELLVELDRRAAPSSWRWFTDDPPETMPWPSFIGLEPDDVGPDDISDMAARFRRDDVQTRVERSLNDPAVRTPIDLTAMPIFHFEPGDRRIERAAGAVLTLALLSALLVALIFRSRHRFLDGRRAAAVRSTASRIEPDDPRARRDVGLLRSELGEISGQTRWRLVATAVVVLMATACILHGLHAAPLIDRQEALLDGYRGQLGGSTLAAFADLDHPALRPPSGISFLANGGERTMPAQYMMAISTWQLPTLDAPSSLLHLPPSPPPDWSAVVWVVLSLSAFLLGYDTLCGRRLERLVLMQALGARRWSLLRARWAALWLAVVVPLVVGAGLGLGVLAVLDVPTAMAWSAAPIVAFLLLALVGLGFFTGLALTVSAWLGDANQALVTLVLVWVASVVVVPSAAAILVLRLDPVPPERDVWVAVEDIRRQVEAIEGSSDWRPGQWARADDFAVERRSARLQVERHRRQLVLLRDFLDRQLDQAATARRVAYLSPVTLLEDIAERLVGAGLYRQRDFVDQAQRFEARLLDWVARLDRDDPDSPRLHFFPRYLSQQTIDPEDLPRFIFVEPSLATGWRRATEPVALFAGLCLLLLISLRLAFERRLSNSTDPVPKT
ncbi:MAG: ABC transporter permease subunit [Acidobacteriota bacterium]